MKQPLNVSYYITSVIFVLAGIVVSCAGLVVVLGCLAVLKSPDGLPVGDPGGAISGGNVVGGFSAVGGITASVLMGRAVGDVLEAPVGGIFLRTMSWILSNSFSFMF